jgi:phosphoribosylformylglycinamidine synthase I
MKPARVLVIRAAGTNCDLETRVAFEKAGAEVDVLHINRLVEKKESLHKYHIFALPGGFSYGDDIASGKILANELKYNLGDEIMKFVDDGKLIIGICNGFQVLVRAGLLPGLWHGEPGKKGGKGATSKRNPGGKNAQRGGDFAQEVTLSFNDSNRYEDRWVWLKLCSQKSEFIRGEKTLYLPVAHAEGKFIPKDAKTLERLRDKDMVVFKYVHPEGKAASYPWNPNGSVDDIAGICDTTGRILGLMPHPERHVEPTNHPRWTREGMNGHPDGMTIFETGVRYVREKLL